jgi:hypothetical protein
MAAALVDELTVMVCTLESEPMPAGLRAEWMRGLLPGVDVVHHDRDMPQAPGDHPDFWPIWGRAIREAHPDPIDYVFGSEPDVARLAEELGARPVPVDLGRRAFPISSSEIRDNPAGNWRHIPGLVSANRASPIDWRRRLMARLSRNTGGSMRGPVAMARGARPN